MGDDTVCSVCHKRNELQDYKTNSDGWMIQNTRDSETIPWADIRVPVADMIVKRDYIQSIPNGISGVYKLYDNLGNLLYIGKSKNLRHRVKEHTSGKSDLSEHFHKISYVECLFVGDGIQNEILETYLINTLGPIFNKAKVYMHNT